MHCSVTAQCKTEFVEGEQKMLESFRMASYTEYCEVCIVAELNV